MKTHSAAKALLLAFLGIAFFVWPGDLKASRRKTEAKFTEELVYAQSEDGVPNAGVLVAPLNDSGRSTAVIWIHGWGVNFYQPSYVKIGRALAQLGYTCVSVNTRMHDVGFNIGDRNGKRVRGGGYWGVASEEGKDIAAWIDFVSHRGFKHVVLVG